MSVAPLALRSRGAGHGFTLVEMCTVVAVIGVLAALGWPSLQEQLNRGRRADAVAALMRVQIAQESFRASNGLYATQLGSLSGATASLSREGLYEIALRNDGPNHYEARATARAGGPMAGDVPCAVLSLQVRDGLAQQAPSARCWNR
jgi:type IV pilus assembly protein PilE